MPREDNSKNTGKLQGRSEHGKPAAARSGAILREVEYRVWAALNQQKAQQGNTGAARATILAYPSAAAARPPNDRGADAGQRSEAAKKGWETRRRHAHELREHDRSGAQQVGARRPADKGGDKR
jgi:hypothetical protein